MVRAICGQHRAWDAEKFGFLDDIVDRYARWLPERATDPRSVFLVAETLPPPTAARPPAPELVGYLVGTIEDAVPIYWIREHAWIHDVWVEPAHRAHGLGRAMVLSAIDAFSCLGVQQMRLETAALNDASRRLFASCGFRVSAVEMLRPLTTPAISPPSTEPAP
jgi:ribosomal protein S18 acetylase RimI-like enzyme